MEFLCAISFNIYQDDNATNIQQKYFNTKKIAYLLL